MLENLTEQPKDKILEIMTLFRADPRDAKVDLGVGVYKDATGVTPVMRAIKAAEHKLWQEQTSKAYTGLAGDPAYAEAMRAFAQCADAEVERSWDLLDDAVGESSDAIVGGDLNAEPPSWLDAHGKRRLNADRRFEELLEEQD